LRKKEKTMGLTYSVPLPQTVHYDSFIDTLPCMRGKLVAVVGATEGGLGYATARGILRLGGDVVLFNRPSHRATAQTQLTVEFPERLVETVDIDLESFDKVKIAAAEFLQRFVELDVLINCVGKMGWKHESTCDGYDIQMQVNFLSHFVLVRELMPALAAAANGSGEARIVNVTTGPRLAINRLDESAFGLWVKSGYFTDSYKQRLQRYRNTKMCQMLFTAALDERLQQARSRIKVIAAHPGHTATHLHMKLLNEVSHVDGFPLRTVVGKLARSPEDGAMAILEAACGEERESGDFLGPNGILTYGLPVLLTKTQDLMDEKMRERVWALSERAVGTFALR